MVKTNTDINKVYLDEWRFKEEAKKRIIAFYESDMGVGVHEENIVHVFYTYSLGVHKTTMVVLNGEKDKLMFEITYDPTTGRIYFDAYQKLLHDTITIEEVSAIKSIDDYTETLNLLQAKYKAMYPNPNSYCFDIEIDWVNDNDTRWVQKTFYKGKTFMYFDSYYLIKEITTRRASIASSTHDKLTVRIIVDKIGEREV